MSKNTKFAALGIIVVCISLALVFYFKKQAEPKIQSESNLVELDVVADHQPTEEKAPEQKDLSESTQACENDWIKASELYLDLEAQPTAKRFKEFSDSIPTAPKDDYSCGRKSKITNLLDEKMDILKKYAGSVFEFTVFLARIQHASDGAAAEGLCGEGPDLLKDNTFEFLRGLQQERDRATNIDCLVTSTYEYTDESDDKIRTGLNERIKLLNNVKEKEFADLRDTLVGYITIRMQDFQ